MIGKGYSSTHNTKQSTAGLTNNQGLARLPHSPSNAEASTSMARTCVVRSLIPKVARVPEAIRCLFAANCPHNHACVHTRIDGSEKTNATAHLDSSKCGGIKLLHPCVRVTDSLRTHPRITSARFYACHPRTRTHTHTHTHTRRDKHALRWFSRCWRHVTKRALAPVTVAAVTLCVLAGDAHIRLPFIARHAYSSK